MTQTTTAVGRALLPHPDLGFDTNDGGTALHTALEAIWTTVSNHLGSRWTGSVSLANTASTTVTHNFGLALAKLKILIFEGGIQQTAAQIAASYTITQSSTAAIAIQNTSGGPKTFDAMVIPYKLAIVDADVDATYNPRWDVTKGTAPTYRDLYVNGAFAHSDATVYNDVIVLGNLTLTANMVIHGQLYCTGQIISNGFKFDCDGDVIAIGGAAMAGANLSVTIRGNVYTAADWTFTNSSASQPTMTIGGDFVAVDTAGTRKTIAMNGSAAAGNVAVPGYILRVGGDVLALAVNLSGGIFGTAAGGAGGSLVVGGDVTLAGALNLGGAAGVGNAGGAGGQVTIRGDLAAVGQTVTTSGGAGGTASAGGVATTQTVMGDVIVGSWLNKGGDGTTSGNGANGGALTINGDLTFSGTVNTTGGLTGTGTGGAGAAIQVDGSANYTGTSTAANLLTSGGSSAGGTGVGGAAGTITVTAGGRFVFAAVGGAGATGVGGAGGAVEIRGPLNGCAGAHSTAGGVGGTASNGGVGGNVRIRGNLAQGGSITTTGGAGTTTGSGAAAGSITIDGDCVTTALTATGGASGNSGSGTGGNGGAITVNGMFKGPSSAINCKGGATTAGSTGKAGNGAAIALDCGGYCNGIDASAGSPSATGTVPGTAGSITTLCGSIVSAAAITADAGSVAGAALTSAASGGAISVVGDLFVTGNISAIGSDGLSAGGASGTLTVAGNCKITGNLTLRGGDNSATTGTGGTAGAVTAGVLSIGFNLFITGIITVRGGDCFTAGLTTGTGGAGEGNALPRSTIGGDLIATSTGRHIFRGGNSKSGTGSAGTGILVRGRVEITGTITVQPGDTRAAAAVGDIGRIEFLGGGYVSVIDCFRADTIVASGTNATTLVWYFGGFLTVGSWNPDAGGLITNLRVHAGDKDNIATNSALFLISTMLGSMGTDNFAGGTMKASGMTGNRLMSGKLSAGATTWFYKIMNDT